jgi:hypothetical protein
MSSEVVRRLESSLACESSQQTAQHAHNDRAAADDRQGVKTNWQCYMDKDASQ